MSLYNPDSKPKLRNVEPVQLSTQNGPAVGLRDPLNMTGSILCFRPETLQVLALMDGRHSLRDIQEEVTRRTGLITFLDDIVGLVQSLDEAYLLESERFQAAFRERVERYRELSVRPCSHAGSSYEADPESLNRQLNSFFTGNGGPGEIQFGIDPRRPLGLIAPHIDVRSGGKCFASAYHALAAGQPSDIYVIFGTGHSGVEGIFTATNLDFETPLGVVRTDHEFLGHLTDRLGYDPAAEEILHASEHVIEFQVIFLQHVFAARHSYTIVPVLCSLSPQTLDETGPLQDQKTKFDEFCRAFRSACQHIGKSVCFIASADLDHIGPRYGDGFIPHKGTVSQTLENDRRMLGYLEALDLPGFVRHVSSDQETSRVCGFSPIAAMLHCMDASEGRLLALDYAPVDDRNSFVSFASMIFH